MSVFDHIDLCEGVLRRGWVARGIERPETVARHMRECVKLASEIAGELGVDREKLMAMMAVHDLPESDSDVGDIIPSDGIPKEVKCARERAAMEKICANFPDGPHMFALWEEFERGETPEAVIAKQIDVYQMLLQARRYQREQQLDLTEFLRDANMRITHPVLVSKLQNL